MAAGGSKSFGSTRPTKRHLVRGTGGLQAEVRDLREDIDLAFCNLEASGQLADYHFDTVDPTVSDDDTSGFTRFSRWINVSSPRKEFVCLDASTGAADWKETTGVIAGGAVSSVFGRTGAVTAAVGDYDASQVDNDSGVAGAFVSDALDTLAALIPPVAPVDSVFGRTGAVLALAGDYTASKISNDSGVSGAFVDDALDTLDSGKVPTSRIITAGAGLVGTGNLTADRTIDVIAHPDGSIVVGADNIQVGILATDAQHGARGGGALHIDATPVSSGFMSFADKAKLNSVQMGAEVNAVDSVFGRVGAVVAAASDYDASQIDNDSSVVGATVKDALETLEASGVQASRTLTAGAGLTGGGDLSADRTFDVVANADGSIVVNADDIQVGVLATDGQHGLRGGGTQHAVATIASAGFMSPADKLKLDSLSAGIVSPWQDGVLDKDLSAPPGGPSVGNRYIVASGGSGAWTGHDDEIAEWSGATWLFFTPVEGFTTYVRDEDLYYTYNTSWTVEILSATRTLTAGAGLTGGGDLSADRTFDVGANADGSIVVNADDIQVGVLATDAQHGARGGGTQHAVAVALGAAGFMSGADKSKLDGIAPGAEVNAVASVFGRTGIVVAAASDYDASQVDNDSGVAGAFVDDALDTLDAGKVPNARTITAGAGLTGGGDLSANRTLDVVANADGSIVVNANDVQVGILASDAQHGSRGGGTQHAAATTSVAGFMSSADKSKLDDVDDLTDFDGGSDTTSGTTELTKVSITIPAEDATWVIFAAALVSMSNTTANGEVRLQNQTDAATLGRAFNKEVADSENVVSAVFMREFTNTAAAGAKTIAMEYSIASGSGTIEISDAYILARKVI